MRRTLLIAALAALIPLQSAADTTDPVLEQAIRQAKAVLAARSAESAPGGADNAAARAMAQPAPAAAEPDASGLASRMFKGLAFCAGIFLVGIAIARRWKGGGSKPNKVRTLSIVERIPLTAKTSLCLVRCGRREILLAVGPDRVTMQEERREQPAPIELNQVYEERCDEDLRYSA